MFDFILKMLLVLTPIAYTRGIPLDKFDLVIFYLSAISLFVASLWSKPQREIPKQFISWILILCGVNLVLNQFNPIVLSAYINLFFGVIIVYLIATYCERPYSCFKYMMFAGLINLVVFFFQRVGFSPIIVNPLGEPGGILGNGPRLCLYLAMTIPFVMKENVLIAIGYMGIGILCGEYVVTAVGAALLIRKYINLNKITISVITVVLISAIFLLHSHILQSFRIRWAVWQPMIEQIFSHPLAGLGVGSLPYVADQFLKVNKGEHVSHCLSSLIAFIFGAGLLALVWFGYSIDYFRRNFKYTTESIAIIVLIFLSIFEYPFEVIKVWITMCAITAFWIISIEKKEKNLCP